MHGGPYTFSVKPKWQTVAFWFFAVRSSAEAYLRTSPPQGHSTVGVTKRRGGFVAIWLRAREEFADNRFHFLYNSRYKIIIYIPATDNLDRQLVMIDDLQGQAILQHINLYNYIIHIPI